MENDKLGFREGETLLFCNNQTTLQRISWNNAFQIYVNSKTYFLKKIYLYNSTGVIVTIDHGWFGNGNNNIDRLVLPEVIRRIKPKFDGETFIIGKKNEAEIYIPFEYFDFNIDEEIDYSGYYITISTKYTSKKDSRVSFVDYSTKRVIVDERRKEYAANLTLFVNGVKEALNILETELKELDYHGTIEAERKQAGFVTREFTIKETILREFRNRVNTYNLTK